MKNKSSRNKTIDISIKEGKHYLENCVYYENNTTVEDMINKNVIGDTFKILKDMEDEIFDLIIIDPPYNLNKNFHGNEFKQLGSEAYEEYVSSWIDDIYRILKKDGTLYVCCDWKSSLPIGNILMDKFIVKNRITWQREKGRGSKLNWKNSMEDIWYCVKDKDNHYFDVDAVKVRKQVIAPYKVDGKPKDWVEGDGGNFRDTHPSNFWDDITIPFWSMSENTAHPTQKPEKLIAKLILSSSEKNDLILDPFSGSGTTGVVAKKLGRNFINIEQNELYNIWSEIRLVRAENDSSIQGYEDGVFWERNTLKRV